MTVRLLAVAFALFLAAPSLAQAQAQVLVVVVDPGEVQVNQAALLRALGSGLGRTAVRMTDERAPQAPGRLTIAFSRPDRWVLRYEAGGQVAWISDRIPQARGLRQRLVELSREIVGRAETPPPRTDWGDVILALRDEIIDPFADMPPREERRPVSVLWSEVVDPFTEEGRARHQVWTEVLDPWSVEVRRSRR